MLLYYVLFTHIVVKIFMEHSDPMNIESLFQVLNPDSKDYSIKFCTLVLFNAKAIEHKFKY